VNARLVAIQAAIAAEQARLEAMKLANAQVDLQASPPKYDESHFWAVANSLDELAIEASNCG
jgi:hypothetical protein